MQPAAVDAQDRRPAGEGREVARVSAGDGDSDSMPLLEQVGRRQQVERQLGDLVRDERLCVAALERSIRDGLTVWRRRGAQSPVDGPQLALGDVGDAPARIDVLEINKKRAVA